MRTFAAALGLRIALRNLHQKLAEHARILARNIASSVLCGVYSVKDHHHLTNYSTLLKKNPRLRRLENKGLAERAEFLEHRSEVFGGARRFCTNRMGPRVP